MSGSSVLMERFNQKPSPQVICAYELMENPIASGTMLEPDITNRNQRISQAEHLEPFSVAIRDDARSRTPCQVSIVYLERHSRAESRELGDDLEPTTVEMSAFGESVMRREVRTRKVNDQNYEGMAE